MKKNKKICLNEQNKRPELSMIQKRNIYNMFFGPYKSEWKDKKGIVLNGDKDIADRLKLDIISVQNYITRISEEHFKRVYELRLKEIKENETREKRRQQVWNRSSSSAR